MQKLKLAIDALSKAIKSHHAVIAVKLHRRLPAIACRNPRHLAMKWIAREQAIYYVVQYSSDERDSFVAGLFSHLPEVPTFPKLAFWGII